LNGHITRVLGDRGFGFLLPEGDAKELFFHVSNTDPAIPFDKSAEGLGVQFEVVTTAKGKQAEKVRPR